MAVKLKSSGSATSSERNVQLARLFEACGLETKFKGARRRYLIGESPIFLSYILFSCP